MTAAEPLDLSVIVISHGHEAMLRACLASLLPALRGLSSEILAIDNLGRGAVEAALAGLPATVIPNPRPVGFAANVNAGARRARGARLLILNPDTLHRSGTLAAAAVFLDAHPDIGVLGCTLHNEDGSRQQSHRRFPTLPFLALRGLGADRWPWRPRFYRAQLMEETASGRPYPVDWVFGAFMLVRRADFTALGGMDEGFRLYYEDVDFCRRAREMGLRTWVFPGLAFTHVHERQSAKRPFSPVWRWHVASAVRYFLKDWRGAASRPAATAARGDG